MEPKATYEKVVSAYRQLENECKSVSADNIRQIVGGSKTTILKLKRDYEENLRQENELKYSMSEDLRNAITKEMLAIAQSAREEMSVDMKTVLGRENELMSLLSESDDACASIGHKLQQARENLAETKIKATKQQAAANQKATDLQEQVDKLSQEKSELQETVTEHRTTITKLDYQYTQAYSAAETMKSKLESLQTLKDNQLNRIVELEKKLSTSEGQVQLYRQGISDKDERLVELKNELKATLEKYEQELERRTQAEKQLAGLSYQKEPQTRLPAQKKGE